MKIRRSAAVAGLLGLGLAAGLTFVGGGAAYAAAPTPPYEPDAQSFGTLSFYDSTGNPIVSGNINTAPMAAYVVGSNAGRAGDNTTLLNMAQPNPLSSTANWNVDNLTGSSAYPLPSTGNPANIVTFSQTHPVSKGTATDFTVAQFIAEFPNDPAHDTNTSYQNLYQLRLVTVNGANQDPQYQVADILVTGTTWRQVYPTVASPTTTVLTAPNPAGQNAPVTLTATVTAQDGTTPAGTVQFKDGATNIGTPAAVNGSGVATTSATFTTSGAHSLSAVFTATDPTAYATSTGTFAENVVPATATSLAVTTDNAAGHDISLAATVTPSTAAGSVTFTEGATTLGTVSTPGTGNVFTLDLPTGLPAGQHTVVATFTPSDPAAFAGSSDSKTFSEFAGACSDPASHCTDQQNISATVPVGTISISTPYNGPGNGGTLNVNLSLTNANTNNAFLSGTATFNNITVIDQRSGNLPYTVSALSSALLTQPDNTTGINAENVGLSGFTGVGSPGFDATAANVTFSDHAPASAPVATSDHTTPGLGLFQQQQLASVNHGLGTFTFQGTLGINAPIATLPGLYNGTITFTVATS